MGSFDAAAIRSLRAVLGITQRELATRLGTDHVTVSRWERGKSVPRPSAQKRLLALMPAPGADAGTGRFVIDPTKRLREVEEALRAQIALKKAMRVGR